MAVEAGGKLAGEIRRTAAEEVRQVVAVAEIGGRRSAQLLFDVDVDAQRLLAVQRGPGLHDGRMRLHVRRVHGRGRTDADGGIRSVRKRRAVAVRRGDGADGRVHELSLVHGGRQRLRLPGALRRVHDGTHGVVRGGHYGDFDGHCSSSCVFRSVFSRECLGKLGFLLFGLVL